jgi:exodeoxyribonuclease VII large subunit
MAKRPGRDDQGELPLFRGQPPPASPAEAGTRPAAPALAEGPALAADAEPTGRATTLADAGFEVLTVAALDRLLKRALERAAGVVHVRGEVSGLRRAASGHAYFTLKDESEDAVIDAVMYRGAPARARQLLGDGEQVVLRGRVTVFAPRGRMQLVVEDVLGSGRGELYAALARLREKLAAEGLFAAERKRPLPRAPLLIAVLTSRDGAAIHDVCRVAFARGAVRILLVPTPVQGAGAAERISQALAAVGRLRGIDAVIVTRGGGSFEDLGAYNDETVVRAIAACPWPVVSAVGHEIDVTLADLVADARAATPSQAAEMLVADDRERLAALTHLRHRLERATRHRLAARQAELARLETRLGEPRRLLLEQGQRFDELALRLERAIGRALGRGRARILDARRRLEARHPRRVLAAARLRLTPLGPRLEHAVRRRLADLAALLGRHAGRLEALSPLGVLGRGYAIVTTGAGRVLTDAAAVAPGDEIAVRLGRGALGARVTGRR